MTYNYKGVKYTTSTDFIVRRGDGKIYVLFVAEEVYNRQVIWRHPTIRANVSMIKDSISSVDGIIIISVSTLRIAYTIYEEITDDIKDSGFRLLNSILDAIKDTKPYPNYLYCANCPMKGECKNESSTKLPKGVTGRPPVRAT